MYLLSRSQQTSHQELLYFVGLGTGSHHSFKISYPETITGNVEKNLVTVSAAGTHGLFNNDTVFVILIHQSQLLLQSNITHQIENWLPLESHLLLEM